MVNSCYNLSTMNWQEFINTLLDQDLRMSALEVEARTGIRQSVINRWQRGEVGKPQRNTIRRLEEGLGIKIIDTDPNNIKYVKFTRQLLPTEIAEINHVPHKTEYKIVASVPAGIADVNDNEWYETVPLEYDPDTHCFIQVDEEFGFSMMPTIAPGDLILISFTQKVQNGDLVAARWDDTKGALKIYTDNPDIPDMAVLTSYNQAIPPIFVNKNKVRLYKVVLIKKKR